MQNLFGDIRYALRQFRLSPVFTVTAVLTLATGIGGTTAIFSLIHAVMLRSLPVADPAGLYRIGDGYDFGPTAGPETNWGLYSIPLYERLKAALPEFEEVAAFQGSAWGFSVRRPTQGSFPRTLRGEFVTGNYFSTFGLRSFAGRLLTPADDRRTASPAAVLSYYTWQGTYGGDPSVVGSTYLISGHPFTIVGIAPPGFLGETLRSEPLDLWMPIEQEPLINGPDSLFHESAWLRAIGRLRPGATITGISARLTGILRQWLMNDSQYPASWMPEVKRTLSAQKIDIIPAGGGVSEMKADYSRSLQILLCVCCLVLLIACANIANLLLARGMARRRQTALRIAVGASRRRIVSQSLIESILLSLFGGLVGVAIADGAAQLIVNLTFHSTQFLALSTAPSLPVLAFAFGLSLVTGVLFGTAPAWFASHADPVVALRGANRSTRDPSSLPRQSFLVLQTALSILLVASAGLLTRSLNNLEHQNFGFETAHRISLTLNSATTPYNLQHLAALCRNLEERLNRLPGVDSAGLALYNPLNINMDEFIFVEGHPARAQKFGSEASWNCVSPRYLHTVGRPILRGRGITGADTSATAPVAVVNEAFVKKYFPNEDPIDKHFGLDNPANAGTYRIVGIVRDAKYMTPEMPTRPMFFVSLLQDVVYKDEGFEKVEHFAHSISSVMLETKLSPGALEPMLKKTLSQVDPNLTIVNIRTMQEHVALTFGRPHAVASLTGLFGLVALTLAAVGLYGVTAYNVSQRTSEIGLRMVLGADHGNVVRLVLRGAFQKIASGLLLGIPLAIGAGKLMSSQLYGVTVWDPFALSVAVVALGICALAATIVPAARAASIDPITVLRMD